MKNLLVCCAVAIVAIATPIAHASQFGFSNQTNVSAAGDIGDPDNTLLVATYNGPATIMTQFNLDGVLRSLIPQTSASEAQFLIGNITQGYAFFFETNALDDEFNTLNVTRPDGDILLFVRPGDEFAFLAADDFDDGPGADAVWDNISLTFSDDRPFTDLGAFAPGVIEIDAVSAAFDTEFGLYDAAGNLIDEGTGVELPLVPILEPGVYYFVVGGEGSIYGDFVATTTPFDEHVGADPFDVSINGSVVATGSLGGVGPNGIFSFTVTPEPSSVVLLVGSAMLLPRRRH